VRASSRYIDGFVQRTVAYGTDMSYSTPSAVDRLEDFKAHLADIQPELACDRALQVRERANHVQLYVAWAAQLLSSSQGGPSLSDCSGKVRFAVTSGSW
jgi:hypothetical protein